MKKLILSLFILISLNVFAQKAEQKMYYITEGSDQMMTQDEFDEAKTKILAKMQTIAKDVKLNVIIQDIKTTKDSIIHTFKLDFQLSTIEEDETVVKKEKIYTYLNNKLPAHLLKTINDVELNLKDLEGKPTVSKIWGYHL